MKYLKIATMVQKLRCFWQTSQIGFTEEKKTYILVLINQPTVHSGGVSREGYAINGVTQSSFFIRTSVK